MSNKIKICFVCRSHHVFSEHVSIAAYLKKESFDPFFIFVDEYFHDIALLLENKGIRYYVGSKIGSVSRNDPEKIRKQFPTYTSIIKQKLRNILPVIVYQIRDSLFLMKKMLIYKKIINKIYYRERPDCIILYSDRSLGMNPPAAVLAKKWNIPIIVLQIASQHVRLLAKYRMDRKMYGDKFLTSNLINRLVLRLFPQQGIRIDGKDVLFFQGHVVLSLFFLGMLPKNPWHLGGSFGDKYLMISKQYMLDGKNYGANCNNVVIVGQLSLDKLYSVYKDKEKIKQKMLEKYFNEFGSGKNIIFVGLPQFYEHNVLSLESSKNEILYLINCLLGNENNLIFLSLHPKMTYENYKSLNKVSKRVKLVKDEKSEEYLPIVDYYFGFTESLVAWAILCDVISVSIDYSNFNVLNNKYSSCHVMRNKENLNVDLQNLFLKRFKDKQLLEKDKILLSPFDGRCGERIKNEIIQSCSTFTDCNSNYIKYPRINYKG